MARTRINGKSLKLQIDSNEYNIDVTSASLVRDASTDTADNVVTFADAAAGVDNTDVWYLDVTAVQSTDDATATDGISLHTAIWDAAATTGGDTFAFVLAPHGNATASALQPHYTGTVKVSEGAFPPVGGDAGSTFTFDYRFEVSGAVTKATS